MKPEQCIDMCNRLLRGERSAVESYDKAIESFDASSLPADLSRIRSEHAEAVSILEENVRAMGGRPDEDSGVWGAFAKTMQGAANAFGTGSSLEVLETGEKSGKRDYEMALNDDDVMPGCKEMILTRLLPKVEEHITTLERLQKAA